MSKFFLSLFIKTNLSAFRAAILANDTNRLCRILDIERSHICKEIDSTGNTALLIAIKYASPLTVMVLIEQGAHPDQSNSLTFQTPLSLLASTVYEDIHSREAKIALQMATMLLDHGAYVDKTSPYTLTNENGEDYDVKETPLMTAARTKNLLMATLFVERKANVNYIEKQTENRPIHFSISNGDAAMFDLLENAGASCRSVVTNGENTLLHWFCYYKSNDEQMSLLKKLLNKGCNINAENNLQRTPLMLAAMLDMINTCHMLLNASADIKRVDYQGNQAIDLARIGSECFKLLQQAKQINSRHNSKTDGILWRKQILSTRSLSRQRTESVYSLSMNKNPMRHYSSGALGSPLKYYSSSVLESPSYKDSDREEFDTKYKSTWEKLLQTKGKIRRSRDSSLPRSRDYSQTRKRDTSQHKTNDLDQTDSCITVKL